MDLKKWDVKLWTGLNSRMMGVKRGGGSVVHGSGKNGEIFLRLRNFQFLKHVCGGGGRYFHLLLVGK